MRLRGFCTSRRDDAGDMDYQPKWSECRVHDDGSKKPAYSSADVTEKHEPNSRHEHANRSGDSWRYRRANLSVQVFAAVLALLGNVKNGFAAHGTVLLCRDSWRRGHGQEFLWVVVDLYHRLRKVYRQFIQEIRMIFHATNDGSSVAFRADDRFPNEIIRYSLFVPAVRACEYRHLNPSSARSLILWRHSPNA